MTEEDEVRRVVDGVLVAMLLDIVSLTLTLALLVTHRVDDKVVVDWALKVFGVNEGVRPDPVLESVAENDCVIVAADADTTMDALSRLNDVVKEEVIVLLNTLECVSVFAADAVIDDEAHADGEGVTSVARCDAVKDSSVDSSEVGVVYSSTATNRIALL